MHMREGTLVIHTVADSQDAPRTSPPGGTLHPRGPGLVLD